MPRSASLEIMIRAATRAARSLARDFGEVEQLQVSIKGPGDFVSAADRRAESLIREELRRGRPDYGFLLEERGAEVGRSPHNRWIVDPLDGTTNFLHGLPFWAISIALEKEGEIVAGIVYEPVRDEMFWAEKGAGAWNNHQRLRVSGRRKLDEAVIATGLPFKGRGNHAEYLPQLQAVMAETAGVRRFGSAALDLAYVAAGRFDGYWESHVQPWDVAAGLLMVTEAGGFASEIGGGRNPLAGESVLAANSHLHLLLGKVLRNASASRKPQAEG